MRRSRRCDNPKPEYNGLDCDGNEEETKECNKDKKCIRK